MIPQCKKVKKYSTEEQVVGIWKNGKPIYEKTINELSQIDKNSHWSNNDISDLDVDEIIDVNGKVKVSTANNTTIQDIRRIVPDNVADYSIGVGDMQPTSIGVLFGLKYTKIESGFLILQYTKK